MALNFNPYFINLGPLTSANFGLAPIDVSNVGPVAPLSNADLLASASRAASSPTFSVTPLPAPSRATTSPLAAATPTINPAFVGPVAPKSTTTPSTTPSALSNITLSPNIASIPTTEFDTIDLKPRPSPLVQTGDQPFVGPVLPGSERPSPAPVTDLTLSEDFLAATRDDTSRGYLSSVTPKFDLNLSALKDVPTVQPKLETPYNDWAESLDQPMFNSYEEVIEQINRETQPGYLGGFGLNKGWNFNVIPEEVRRDVLGEGPQLLEKFGGNITNDMLREMFVENTDISSPDALYAWYSDNWGVDDILDVDFYDVMQEKANVDPEQDIFGTDRFIASNLKDLQDNLGIDEATLRVALNKVAAEKGGDYVASSWRYNIHELIADTAKTALASLGRLDVDTETQLDNFARTGESALAERERIHKQLTKSDNGLGFVLAVGSAMFAPSLGPKIGAAMGFTTPWAAAAAGAGTISTVTQFIANDGKIDPGQVLFSAAAAGLGQTGNLTGADIAEQAADLTANGLPASQVASTLESVGINPVTANLSAQFAAAGIPATVAPMLTSGVTNGSLSALAAINNKGDWSSAFRDGFLTGASGEASAFAVNELLGDDVVRRLADATNLTPAQINGIAAQSLSSAINAEVLNTGNFFDVIADTAISLGVGQSGANAIMEAFGEKLDPKSVAAMTSVARDTLTTATSAVMNNRDPGAAVSANWVNTAVNAVNEAIRAPSQEAVDANRQSRIDAEVSKVETGELSSSPAAVEAYQNALGEGKTQTEAIDAAKRVVATERVDAAAAGTTGTAEPVIIKDETGADVEVFKVPSWNIKEGRIDPKPMENVYRDANGNVYVNTVTEDGTSVTVSAPQFLSTALGIGIQSATELVSNFYNGARLMGGMSPDSPFSKMLDEINKTGGKMESLEIQAGKEDISRRLNEAEGFDVVTELFRSAFDNPSAAASYVAIELPQELAVIGVAARIAKTFNFMYGLGADAFMNALDAGGADGKQAFDEAIAAGKSPEEAMDIAVDVFTTSAALSGVISPFIDAPFLKGATKANVPTVGRSGTQIAKDVRNAGTATAKESVEEFGQSFTVAGVTDYLITGEVDWGDAFRQGATNSFYGGHTAGATSATMSTINTSTGPVANNLSVVDPSNASSHLTMINDTLASSPNTSAAASTISTNLQNTGMPAAQANNIANTAIAESIVADVNANADGQFQIGDLNTAIGVDSNGDAVTLGDYLGSNYTNLGSTQVAINPSAVIGTDVDGTPLTIQNIQDLSTSITIDTSVTTDPNTNVVTETKTDVNPNTNVVTETTTDVDPNTNTQTETKTDVDPNTNTVVETNTTTDPNTGVVTETETSTNVETDTQVVTRTETDPVTGDVETTTGERKPDEEEKEEKEEKFRRLLQGGAAGATLLAAASPATSKIMLPEETWLGGKPRVTPEMLDLFKIFAKDTPEMQEQEIFSALRRASGLEDSPGSRPLISEPSYYSYGAETTPGSVMRQFRRGGTVQNPIPDDTMMGSPLARASGGDVEHKGTHYVQGAGGGQDDLIPAKLADGEYVFDAEIVAALGDGSNKEGAKILDKFREEIRKHKRGGSTKTIPPKAKSPLAYLRSVT